MEVVNTASQPFSDAELGLDSVVGLHSEPGNPLLARLVLVARKASGNTICSPVFSATAFRADVVNSQVGERLVYNWSAPTVSTAVVPSFFYGSTPLVPSFSSS